MTITTGFLEVMTDRCSAERTYANGKPLGNHSVDHFNVTPNGTDWDRPAASVKVGQCSVISVAGTRPGSTFDERAAMTTESPSRSLPVKSRGVPAAAPLKLLWPDAYSGNGGVGKVGVW